MRVEIIDLKKKYLSGFELVMEKTTLNSGETIGLVGNNGAGKTTVFKILLDLVQINSGKITLDKKNIFDNSKWKSNLGAFLSTDYLIPFLTPLEYFKFIGSLSGYDKNTTLERLYIFKNFLSNEIIHARKKLIRDYSKGNQVKIGIAAALLCDPDIILLDEPFSGLDPSSQIMLQNFLKNLSKRESKIMIISSHNLQHISEICSRVVILEDGRMIEDKKTDKNTFCELKRYFNTFRNDKIKER